MTIKNDEEIRCYGNPQIVTGFIAIMALFPLMLIVVSLLNGRFTRTIWLPILMWFLLGLFWYASRWGTFIVVNKIDKTLFASNFFIKTQEIPIDSIISIGTRGMFIGAATLVQITYLKPGGKKMTLGYGTKNYLDHEKLKLILEALVAINPKLTVPVGLTG